ncbi:MAG: transglutaminase-like domain-containing protein [Gammaproteobacteria bacterium]|nr:transglutaminase-like domain-containing protein [Gammaproteobacteria bacterium]
MKDELQQYLTPTEFLDSDNPEVQRYAQQVVEGSSNDQEKAVKLYYAVRDNFRYNPYAFMGGDDTFVASNVLAAGEGFCVPKAILLAALGRAVGIPTRLGFADVRNHLTSPKLKQMMKTDIFAFHGNTGFFINNQWVKCTPAFNLSLCEKANIKALEFNGTEDSLFHPIDNAGNKHMEYLRDRGDHADFPKEAMMQAFGEVYGNLLGDSDLSTITDALGDKTSSEDFESEVVSE